MGTGCGARLGHDAVKKLFNKMQTWALALIVVSLIGANAYAQDPTGRIIGTVSDPQGSSVAGVGVTVTNAKTQVSKQVVTNKDGYYQVLDLPIGTYKVTMQHDGFRQLLFENQVLEISQSLRVDGKLELGAQTQTVEVKDQVSVVETVDPTIGGSVTGRTITDAPLNGRNTLSLALLQPGVTNTNDGDTGSGQGFNIAGGR